MVVSSRQEQHDDNDVMHQVAEDRDTLCRYVLFVALQLIFQLQKG